MKNPWKTRKNSLSSDKNVKKILEVSKSRITATCHFFRATKWCKTSQNLLCARKYEYVDYFVRYIHSLFLHSFSFTTYSYQNILEPFLHFSGLLSYFLRVLGILIFKYLSFFRCIENFQFCSYKRYFRRCPFLYYVYETRRCFRPVRNHGESMFTLTTTE